MKRLLVRVAIGLAAALVVVVLLAAFLLGTRPGARFVLDRLGPGVEVGGVQGRLWGPLVLEDLRVTTPGLVLEAGRVRLEWRPTRLLRRTVDVRSLEVRAITATLRATEPAADSGGLPRPSVPLGIALHRLQVDGIRVLTEAGDTVAIEAVNGSLTARDDRFVVDSVRVTGVGFAGHRLGGTVRGRAVTGAVAARDTARLRVAWSGRLADGRELAGEGVVRGGGGRYALEHDLSAPVAVRLAGDVTDAWDAGRRRWRLEARVPRFDVGSVVEGQAGEAAGEVTASGDSAGADVALDADGRHPTTGPVTAHARLRVRGRTVFVDTVTVERTAGDGAVAGSARIELGDEGPSGRGELRWRGLGWPLDSATVASPHGRVRFEGRAEDFHADAELALEQPDRPLGEWTLRVAGSYREGLDAALDWAVRLPDQPIVRGDGRVRFGADRLELADLEARIGDGPGRVSVTADIGLADTPRGVARVRWSRIGWPLAGDSVGFTSPTGRLDVEGSLDAFTVTAAAELAARPATPSRLDMELRGGVDSVAAGVRIRLDTLDVRLPETGGRLAGRGQAVLAEALEASGRVRWTGLVWPLRDPVYRSDAGRMTVATRAGDVRAMVSARVGGGALPESEWRVVGRGDPRGRFVVDSLRGDLLGGRVDGSAVVHVDSGPSWRLLLRGDSLDPGEYRDAWPGRVGFELETDGRLGDDGPTFTARLARLAGTLRGRDLEAAGTGSGTPDRIVLDTLWIRSGPSTIEAAGTLGDTVDARFRIDAASLADLAPGVSGRFAATGRIEGPRAHPLVTIAADGDTLAGAGWTADRLEATAEVDAGERPWSATAMVAGLEGPSLALDTLTIEGRGTRADHILEVTARAPSDTLEVRLAGGLADGEWRGELDALSLRSARAGHWGLGDPASLVIGPDRVHLDTLCWTGSGELCMAVHRDPAGTDWRVSGTGLPLAFLAPALPRRVTLDGAFELESHGTATPGGLPRGELRIEGGPGELEYARDVGDRVSQDYDGFAIAARSDSAGIQGDGRVDFGRSGRVEFSARLPGTGPVESRRLAAELSAQLEDDGTLGRFVPALADSRGRADATLEVGGTVRAPEIRGRVSVSGLETTVVPAGIRLRDGRLVARGDGGRWELDGGIRADTGSLTLAGSVRPPSPDSAWSLDVIVQGERFRAVQTPEIMVSASPDLRLRASPDSVRVTGEITVPRARIAVRRLETTVSESPDVVIVGEETGTTRSDTMVTPAAVTADLRLILGDSVTLDALGLTGRLDGQLSVRAEPTRPPVGSGELSIQNGRYRIYRQTFQIDRGRLLYSATPLTNPALDLRITRRRDDVVAGMEITGRADDPRVQLFSDPSLSDDEVLAYLIVGRPLRRLSQSEGSQVQDAAERVGVAGGNLVLARLSSLFGLERARIERVSSGAGEASRRNTNLVLGGRILPRVHLDYIIGLTGTANIVRLRYMITDHWILQTESGEETGADLLYSIER